jgi:regulator of protease activity HflC (stomatin/prohibitin superfamily)
VRRSAKDKPPYYRYAFMNPYNLSVLAGAGAAAAATGHWWVGLIAAAGEAVWMLFAPDSRLLQRTWFDKIWQGEQAEARKRRQAEKFNALPDAEKERALALRELQGRIQRMAGENPTFTVEMLRGELGKLEDLVDDFLDLATVCARYDRYLATINLEEIEADLRRYQLQAEKLPPGDERRTVAQKNLQVLLSRKDRYKDLRRSLQTARGQMDLMENTFRLLADEIVSMRSASELGSRLDDLREGVEAVRATSRETERFFQTVEQGH